MRNRFLLFTVIVVLLLAIPVVSADDPIIIKNSATPVFDEKPLDVVSTKYVPIQKSILTTILEFIGLESKETVEEKVENTIDVFVKDYKVATIPQNSKFADMEIHNKCLPYQFGTDGWYECERELL